MECIIREKPDVVCTDVRMPDISGIDLIKNCRPQTPDTIFVVVSAYAEFEYARQAVEYGAFSYILKPLEENEIENLSDRLITALKGKKQKQLRETIRFLTIHTLFGGDLQPFRDVDLLNAIVPRDYRLIVCSRIPENVDGYWSRIYDDLALGILPGKYKIPENLLCGMSQPEHSLAQLAERLREALIGFYTLRFYGVQRGAYSLDRRERLDQKDLQYLFDNWEGSSFIKVNEALGQFKTRILEGKPSILYLTALYNSILRRLIALYPDAGLQEELSEFDSCFRMYGVMHTADVLFDSIRALFENCGKTDSDGIDAKDLVSGIVRYVDQHYMEPMTLEQLTEQFNISLSYLCRCFKRETGSSFTNYLKQKRIERACELLIRSDLTVAQIGSQLGFTDYCYFTKVFKKSMGRSPSKYRVEMQHG